MADDAAPEVVGDIAGAMTAGAVAGLVAGPFGVVLGAGTGAGLAIVVRRRLGEVLAARQTHRAVEFLECVQAEAAIDDKGLVEVVGDPMPAELLEQGLDAAIAAASEDKRRLLGRVVAAALREPDDTRIDESGLLVRTVAALEPVHLRALVLVATAGAASERHPLMATRLEGAVREEDLARRLGGEQQHLAGPILSSLAREALIVDSGVGTYDYVTPTWELSPYGRLLLRYLAPDQDDGLFDQAEVVIHIEPDGVQWFLIAKNLGPGVAHEVVVTAHHRRHPPVGPIALGDLEPGGHLAELFANANPFQSIYPGGHTVDLAVEWADSLGPRVRRRKVVQLPVNGLKMRHLDVDETTD